MGRMARGWRLVMSSWGLVWEEPRLLALPAASLGFIGAAIAAAFALAGGPAAIAGCHLRRCVRACASPGRGPRSRGGRF